MNTNQEPEPIGVDALEGALSLRDLSDPAHGTHAMQVLLERMMEGLNALWPGAERRVRRGHPVVSVADNYDRLGYPPDAVAREARYTRWVGPGRLLRTHTTAMIPPALRQLAAEPTPPPDVLLLCPGLIWRRDVVDRLHTGAPHQMDVWRARRGVALGRRDLLAMVRALLDAALPDLRWRTVETRHPYTRGGLQVDVDDHGTWVEVAECGVASPVLLGQSGLAPDEWSGLALGAGLDRLLMLRKGIQDIRLLRSEDPRVTGQLLDLEPWRPVSNQPAVRRDLSIAVAPDRTAEELGDRVREAMGTDADALEALEVLSETPADSIPAAAVVRLGLGRGQKNVLLRLVIRHPTRTLTAVEANRIRNAVYAAVHEGTAWQWAAGS
jgi:phenylalanyl-tRNA synthetase alpha chain